MRARHWSRHSRAAAAASRVVPRAVWLPLLAAAATAAAIGCSEGAPPRPAAAGRESARAAARRDTTSGSIESAVPAPAVERAEAPSATPRFDSAAWRPPADSEIPHDSLGAAIRRGLALVVHTNDSLPRYAPGRIACASCHIGAGRDRDALPLGGAFARYPRYVDRTGAVVTLADRVNYCFTRSLAGLRLPTDSREMADIIAYVAFLSRGVPAGSSVGAGLPPMPDSLVGDTARGGEV